jgi:hypothetical protein
VKVAFSVPLRLLVPLSKLVAMSENAAHGRTYENGRLATRGRGRCSESSEARLDADPYKDQRDRDQDADYGDRAVPSVEGASRRLKKCNSGLAKPSGQRDDAVKKPGPRRIGGAGLLDFYSRSGPRARLPGSLGRGVQPFPTAYIIRLRSLLGSLAFSQVSVIRWLTCVALTSTLF